MQPNAPDRSFLAPPDQDPVRRLLERHMPWMSHDDLFSTHYFAASHCPVQGWKLHVSATPWSATEVLARVIPVLLDRGVSCKVVGTRLQLLQLNNGHYGTGQVGKFITAYPASDDEAVGLAVALDEATTGWRGPRIRSDQQLRPGSLVHYRYGVFQQSGSRFGAHDAAGNGEVEAQDALGDLRDSAGRLFADRRQHEVRALFPCTGDPFEGRGVYVPTQPRKPPIADRYLIVDVLGCSAVSAVYRAIDLGSSPPRLCVLKEFWHDTGGDLYGRLSPDWGEAEADLLARHDSDSVFPRCLDRFELEGDLFVALEYVEGRSLAAEMEVRGSRGEVFSLPEMLKIGEDSARILAHLHEQGVVFRDFSPANLIRTESGDHRLIDFGIAHEVCTVPVPPSGLGTAAYCSREQWAGGLPSPADDVFSWAALMYAVLCGGRAVEKTAAEPLREPARIPSVRESRPDVPTALAEVIERAGAWEISARYPTMREVEQALREAVTTCPRTVTDPPRLGPGFREPASRTARALDLAREVGDALCDSGIERDGGLCWPTRTGPGGAPFCGPDIYQGAAGIALFLAALGRATGEGRYTSAAREAARWLAGPVWASGRAQPGLYCGESGVGWFFVRLAELLDEPAYLSAAELRARRLQGVRFESFDLLHGAAGYVTFLVRLAQATAKRSYLDEALRIGKWLIRSAKPAPDGRAGWCWPSAPQSLRNLHNDALLGLAHGAAGISLALLELGVATESESVLRVPRATGELLLSEVRPHPDGGWCWRESLHDESMRLQGQCHGAIGIGQFLLRLGQIEARERCAEAACQAAITAMRELPRRATPGLCHGAAGDGNFLLDCFQFLGDRNRMREARTCANLLQRFRDPERPGTYLADQDGISRPDLCVGDAGVGWFFLRLEYPDSTGDPVLG
ncbi:protein kinase [Streptomyces sp. NBC_00249]|uniref:lanthionine synthetase LanC family protein n=1 Tax=Streptomyces sp. NBC_00249 TaxID=2975690 RepID=UPI00225AD6CE|nr:lanthionine synthetase LanC family protein [Streptomyces sp. NBC_00249]MCX5195308.1 protein kinase [Streptomyces sp. NBC_00249]